MTGSDSSPLGVLGGTFDPVHNAHLALARAALDRLGIAQVLWIPAGLPPHRAAPQVAAADRLAMVQSAIASEPRFQLDASEVASHAPSYTVHTLQRLRRQFGPARPLVLLMGADAFLGLPRWHRWQELFGLAHLAVATRPGFPLESLSLPLAAEMAERHSLDPDAIAATPCGRILTFELIAGTVSATEVRDLLAAHAPAAAVAKLVPPDVLDYIHQHSLYCN
ncbi:MAG: nicotinate-nucleotide adenylyltransferase [Rhodobacteraceae bacterium]|nr:MAG: nicotinate-nucleotide adenylyltransferase [Paracoccaceae bacterium]